jgi:uncharacterized heparinase superfamily protein
LTAQTIAERIRLAQLRAAAGVSRLRRQAAVPLDFAAGIVSRPPGQLLIAPQDIRTADATVADDIYSGYFAFAAKVVDVHGQSPFLVESPSPEWEAQLMGFGWLRHLRAAGTPLAKANARALIEEWMRHAGRPSMDIAWQPPVAARRLLSWLSHSPVILEDADLDFYRKFLRSIGRHVAWLRRASTTGPHASGRLIVLIALTEAALCSDGSEAALRKTSRQLAQALNQEILVDGGPIGRNPHTLVNVLLDLLPLRQAFVARAIAVPEEINNAIDRMMPMLRLFRHSDGALGLFNGMGLTAQDELATVLAYDDARALPLTNASATGYQRMEAGETIILCETGRPPPREYSKSAHAGALSFELSSAGERLMVNCGAPLRQHGQIRQAARLTAAHSTVVIADTSSCRIAGTDGVDELLEGCIVSGPQAVPVEREDREDGISINASHDGYARAFGLLHQRSWQLSADGNRLQGADRILAAPGKKQGSDEVDFAIRFHLHPSVKAGVIENGQGALLVTPSGQQWIFHASGFPLTIEESAFFAAPEGTRTTSQIVLIGKAKAGDGIDWVLMRKG